MKKQTITMENGTKVVITKNSHPENVRMFNDFIKRASK